MAHFVFLLTLMLQTVLPTLSCSPYPVPHSYNAEETFRAAKIVILGTYKSDFIGEPVGPEPPITSKHVIVDVDCTYKSVNATSIPDTLTLNGNHMYHSCFHSELEPNQTYIMALSWHAEDPDGFFRIFEPNVASVGTFKPEDNQDAIKATCGFSMDSFGSEICESCDRAVTNDGFEPPENNAGRKIDALMATSVLIVVSLLLQF